MNLLENRFINRVLHKTLWAVVLPLCALAAATQALSTHVGAHAPAAPARHPHASATQVDGCL